MAQAGKRPIAPHLMDGARLHWRWGPGMLVSILHRVSGVGLSLVGLPVLLWWLGALASGPDAYATFAHHAGEWYGIIVLIGLTWALFEHTLSGIRHFVLDLGAGYELDANNRWAASIPLGAIVLTALFWAVLLLHR